MLFLKVAMTCPVENVTWHPEFPSHIADIRIRGETVVVSEGYKDVPCEICRTTWHPGFPAHIANT
jgi:hypothetical protein